MNENLKNILVIRRDNIGDLVCTTPLFSLLRKHYPTARISALVNSYNAQVLQGNPDIDQIHVYTKLKHSEDGLQVLSWLKTLRLMLKLRQTRFDLAIVATSSWQPNALKFAKWVKPKRIIAYGPQAENAGDWLAARPDHAWHEAEAVVNLLTPLGITATPGALKVFSDPTQMAKVPLPAGTGPVIGLHISARKPMQRWSVEKFAALATALNKKYQARFLLFWSPGNAENKFHPGDDEKAASLLATSTGLPILPCPTESIGELIAGLAHCSYVVCSDGGAMHLAAGLGKPLVCFFGNSTASHWRPWGVPHRLLQPPSQVVEDISVDEVLAAIDHLLSDIGTRQ